MTFCNKIKPTYVGFSDCHCLLPDANVAGTRGYPDTSAVLYHVSRNIKHAGTTSKDLIVRGKQTALSGNSKESVVDSAIGNPWLREINPSSILTYQLRRVLEQLPHRK